MILLWKSGNENAFSQIYSRYVLDLLKIAAKKTNNRDDAEELVQNCFLKLYQHKNKLANKLNLFAYLYVILKNQVFNYHRSLLTHQKYENYVLHKETQTDNSLLDFLEAKDLESEIYGAIEKLPEKCKNVFLLSRKKHLSNKQIANILNISENTVEQHMRKALGRLRISLKHYLSITFFIAIIKNLF